MSTAEKTVHSELGASSYKRWKACPGSVALSRGIEKRSSQYAERGTLAHEYAANILLRELNRVKSDLEQEDLDAIGIYFNFIESLRAKDPTFEQIEQKLDLVAYHPKLFGTGDYICYFSETKTLHVVDYKHGAGVPVEVVEGGKSNVQLAYYAAAALHKNPVPIQKIVTTIVQPRCFHRDGPIRSCEISPIELVEFLGELVRDAERTEGVDPELSPGSHCRWCPAQGVCPAVGKMAVVSAQEAFSPALPYDPQKLSETLSKLDQIEAWATGVREFAYREAEAGREIPGWKLVDKRPSRKWMNVGNPEELALVLGVDPEDLVEKSLKSIPQIEKLLSKHHKHLLEQFTLKESSGKKLVPIEDDREATLPKVRTVFEKIEKGEQ